FFIRFADPGINHLFWIAPGLECAIQLTPAGYIKAASLGREKLENIDIPAGLDRITNRCLQRRKRLRDLPIVMQKRRLGINISRRPHLAGNPLDRNLLAMKLAVFVVKEVHKY